MCGLSKQARASQAKNLTGCTWLKIPCLYPSNLSHAVNRLVIVACDRIAIYTSVVHKANNYATSLFPFVCSDPGYHIESTDYHDAGISGHKWAAGGLCVAMRDDAMTCATRQMQDVLHMCLM